MEWKGRKVLALAVCLGLNIVQTYAAPAPEVPVYRSFKDWEVGCDNTRRCTAIGLQPEDYAAVTAFLRVERAADGLAPPVVRILLAKEGLAPGDPVTLTMDGGPIQGVPSQRTIDSLESEVAYPSIRLAANETTPFFHALRSGKRLQLTVDHATRAEISLDGAVAALLFIDDVQGRLDTVTAFIRRGLQAAPAAPAPEVPEVTPRPAADGETVAENFAATVGRRMARGGGECEDVSNAQAYPLGGGRVLVGLPCESGAYNFATEYAVAEVDDAHHLQPAAFPQPGETGRAATTSVLYGSDVDVRSGQVSSFSRGRGPGDCGSRAVYAWTGEQFATVSFATLRECRGVPDPFWPVLWRSKIVGAP
ncbi:MAG: DUF1176 domain-containing protein [Rhodospirillales bacterium]